PAELLPAEVLPAEVLPAELLPAEVLPAEVLPAEALSVEAQTLKSEPVILPKDHERIQTLSAYAEQALVEGDFLRAYQSLREALTYSPPIMATYILSRQLVQILNEMGLYEESISVMEKVLNKSTSLSPKKREEFIRQISYLEELTKQLQIENKRNLSWSLVPPYIHQKVNTHFHTSVVSNHDHSTAIPFQ
ncbi:hypothetical protein, partial [Brevibacillus sp. FIR094]|uniref:hypothetical protein n=1 Tax=Brevibacillus sp. FIR094 TaxID=3134809 RepID=UPI003D1DB3C2